MFDPVLIDTVTRILSFNVFGSYFNGRVLVRGLRSSKRRVSWRLGAIISNCVKTRKDIIGNRIVSTCRKDTIGKTQYALFVLCLFGSYCVFSRFPSTRSHRRRRRCGDRAIFVNHEHQAIDVDSNNIKNNRDNRPTI
jgi:hypothetical protein